LAPQRRQAGTGKINRVDGRVKPDFAAAFTDASVEFVIFVGQQGFVERTDPVD
jgi:hypothetical protein